MLKTDQQPQGCLWASGAWSGNFLFSAFQRWWSFSNMRASLSLRTEQTRTIFITKSSLQDHNKSLKKTDKQEVRGLSTSCLSPCSNSGQISTWECIVQDRTMRGRKGPTGGEGHLTREWPPSGVAQSIQPASQQPMTPATPH